MTKKRGSGILTVFKDIVAPAHTALVVWDVQNMLVDRSFNQEIFLKNTKRLIDKARSHQIPIIYTKITPLPREYESPFRIYMMMKRVGVDDPDKLPQFMVPGTPEAEMMHNYGIKTIVYTGISTEIGIASSARDSANRGFYTVVVGDCVSSSDQEAHEMTLKILERVCIISQSEALIKTWG